MKANEKELLKTVIGYAVNTIDDATDRATLTDFYVNELLEYTFTRSDGSTTFDTGDARLFLDGYTGMELVQALQRVPRADLTATAITEGPESVTELISGQLLSEALTVDNGANSELVAFYADHSGELLDDSTNGRRLGYALSDLLKNYQSTL